MEYRYFVFFVFTNMKGESGTGHCVMTLRKCITEGEQLTEIEQWVKSDKRLVVVIITNFILIEETT